MRVTVINGPNLNLLGTREPEVYGTTTLSELETRMSGWASALNVDLDWRQSNSESEVVEWLQTVEADGVIINPAALSHTSRTIADAISSIDIPAVEVHISNIKAREPWRAESFVSEACDYTIFGRGLVGYRDSLLHLVNRAAIGSSRIRYGPHEDNIGDFRGSGRQLVVLVHGGFWRDEYTRDTMESIAVDLAQSGIATWNLEYRRGRGWPGSGHDVLMAIDFIPQLPDEFDDVTVIGHSAGSYLSMWAIGRTRTPVDRGLHISGIFDLSTAATSATVGAGDCQTMLDLGAPTTVEPGSEETVLFHGLADDIVESTQSSDLASRSSLEFVPADTGHFQWLDPSKDEWQLVKSRIPSPA